MRFRKILRGSWGRFQQRILQCFQQWRRLENCVRFPGGYFEQDWGIIIIFTSFLYLVSTLGPHFSQLLSAALSYFPESHRRSEISSLSRVILVLGKARCCRVPILGCRGWYDIFPKNCTRHDAWVDMLLWWSCQSPVAHSCSLQNLSSFCRGM